MSLIESALSEKHRDIRDRATAFATDIVEPEAERIERVDEFPREVINEAGEYGLLGIMVPEEYGGEGSDFLSYCLAVEQIAEVSGAVAETIQGHTFAMLPILNFGTDEQRKEYLEPMVQGERVGAMLLTEPGAGSSPTELETVAEADGEDYSISGEKSFGTNAGVADVHLVVARKRPAPEEGHGVSVFLVPSVDDGEGFAFERKEFMGMRGHITGDSTFDDVRVDESALLGEVGEGFRIAMGTIDMARTGLGAIGTGIARGAFGEAIDYAGARDQGGQAVGQYQAVQVLVADMDARLDGARHLVYDSAKAIADGEPSTRKSSKAKYVASEAAEFVTRNAIQVHGGKGYRKDLPLERFYRDAKILSIIGGTNEIQKTTVAGEALNL
ncbi:acyl-CoA dehydrogenase family protein [Halalkalicoccus jeotgali]|uniref:Acyl-CoA dehydrogenase n=1 Tax=Halalkalicoccus jeotgali (strain DSM 18796 / CECT 7217 / JCM 14584 / KCTC 4019 / B3) TaxID=795797 RepID=D8JB25_HALJB|nr:acyl-CoA dehydrogenase family protein [Halalkalicoccus jeotgali]ADJ16478.1 acyl-CoA dehydrogenase domain protein [Halalkalicoccus jeotgali B3]ELY41426.1 acyl-CoA dehydrogenase [Halalkalicoccus jeotgali B3]